MGAPISCRNRLGAMLGSRNVFGIPIVLIYLVALAAIIWFVLEHTPMGRYLFAVGANEQARKPAALTSSPSWKMRR